jgi:hypothetical protein
MNIKLSLWDASCDQVLMQEASWFSRVFKPRSCDGVAVQAHFRHMCRKVVVEQARERLYGALQSYQGLLVSTGFCAKALHVYETPFPADEADWKEVGCFQLPDKA